MEGWKDKITQDTKSVEQQKMTIEITTKQTFLLERSWTRNSNKMLNSLNNIISQVKSFVI